MTLIIGGVPLGTFLALIAALVLLSYALGRCGRYSREYDQGLADAPGPAPAGPPPAQHPLDLLEAALAVVEHEQEARWAGDLVLRGRLLELEIIQMADEAERRIGQLAARVPGRAEGSRGPRADRERNITRRKDRSACSLQPSRSPKNKPSNTSDLFTN